MKTKLILFLLVTIFTSISPTIEYDMEKLPYIAFVTEDTVAVCAKGCQKEIWPGMPLYNTKCSEIPGYIKVGAYHIEISATSLGHEAEWFCSHIEPPTSDKHIPDSTII